MTRTMQYTRKLQEGNKPYSNKLLVLLLLITVFMFPLGGTTYFQILFAYFVLMHIILRNDGKVSLEDRNIKTYATYYLFFAYTSAFISVFNGITLYAMIADFVTSSLPLVAMYVGSKYADRFKERSQIKLAAIILAVEFAFGFMQNINESFRVWSFTLYGSSGRLISYIAEDVGRAIGTIGSPNYYGLVCVIFGILFICRMFETRTFKSNILNIVMSALTVTCVIFSVSKTSVLCLGFVVIMCVMLSYSLKPYQKFFCMVICTAAILYLIPQFELYSNRTIDLTTMTGRTSTWERIINEFVLSNPFSATFGYGNSFATYKNLGSYPDSYYIILLLEQGIIGAFSYFCVWGIIASRLIKQHSKVYRKYAIALIVVMLASDVTAAISDMPIVCVLVYYMIGRYSRLSYLEDEVWMAENLGVIN